MKKICVALITFLYFNCSHLESKSLNFCTGVENEYCFVSIDKCDIYFYMPDQKEILVRQMVEEMPDLKLVVGSSAPGCKMQKLLVQAFESPKKDPFGNYILQNYGNHTKTIAEEFFGIDILSPTFDLNINFNWESLGYQRGKITQQHSYICSLVPPVEPLVFVKDLTFADWQMPAGTFAGAILQDGEDGDRMILTLHPREVVGTFFVEPAEHSSHWQTLKLIDVFPFQADIVPTNFLGLKSPGVSKGKSICSSMTGVALKQDLDAVREKATQLFFSRRRENQSSNGKQWEYTNGIFLKELPSKDVPFLQLGVNLQTAKENVGIEHVNASLNGPLIQMLADLFGIDSSRVNNVIIKRLTKKDGGFSQIANLDLNISPNCEVVLVNNSKVPDGYQHFNLAQDCSKHGMPWIQLYRFDPGIAMKVSSEIFNELLLTPLEEIFYKDASQANGIDQNTMIERFATCIDIFIFLKEA